MGTQEILRTAGEILAAGLVAATAAALLRIPAMIAMVVAGVVIGPSALGWVEVPLASTGAQLIFSFGVAMILFHGGVGVSLRVISRTAVGLGLLVLPGVMLTSAIVAVPVMVLFGLDLAAALMVGAVLAATDPAIVIPLFERLGLRPKVSQTVIAESAFNDPTSTVVALSLSGVVIAGSVSFAGPLEEFASELAIGAAFGIGGGILIALLLSTHRLGFWSESPAAAILMLVALEYFINDRVGGSAYLAAFLTGLIVGNMDLLRLGQHDAHAHALETYVAQTAEIAVLAVFVILGVNLPLADLWDNLWQGIVVMAVFMLVARPLTVLACLLPDRRGRWTRPELTFMAWSRYTGVVPAAVASLLVARAETEPALAEPARVAFILVAMAVCATLLLQATTAGPLARRLGLVERDEVLILE